MSATLVLAVWIATSMNFQAALPFAGEYQIRQYANTDQGIDDFMKWVDTPGHDKIDLICVAITGGEGSKAAQFWREAEVKRIVFLNPLQIEVMTKNPLVPVVNAITVAQTCAEMFPVNGDF